MAPFGNYEKLWLTDRVTTSSCVYDNGSVCSIQLDFPASNCPGLRKSCGNLGRRTSPSRIGVESKGRKGRLDLSLASIYIHLHLAGTVLLYRRVVFLGVKVMEWTTPQFEEIALNCEINSYASAAM